MIISTDAEKRINKIQHSFIIFLKIKNVTKNTCEKQNKTKN